MASKILKSRAEELWRFGNEHLRELRTDYGFAASDAATGIYATLFGRDSLWILMFLLEAAHIRNSNDFSEWVEDAGANVFEALCKHQGDHVYDATEEQPGKIIHEFRHSLDQRLMDLGLAFDQGKSYSGFDQTFLFVSAFRQFSDMFPSSPVIAKTWPSVERALGWIQEYGDEDNDGLFEYSRRNPNNQVNQVWKDSFDSILQIGVDIPHHPLSWIEVQGYGYRAFVDAAHLYSQRCDVQREEHFKSRAKDLKRQVNEQFWLDDEDCYAIGLNAEKSRIRMISSNASHALWAGIVDQEREEVLVRRLMQPDMLTRYGLRTLSSNSPFYAPFAYHRGNIWPFDNAVFTMGLLGRGYRSEALRVIEGVSSAITIINSPIELYIVLEEGIIVSPPTPTREVLTMRRPDQENRNQGWTAAALVYFAAVLASIESEEIPNN